MHAHEHHEASMSCLLGSCMQLLWHRGAVDGLLSALHVRGEPVDVDLAGKERPPDKVRIEE